MVADQAAGLRAWVEQQQPAEDSQAATAGPQQTMIVVGLPPEQEEQALSRVREQLKGWQAEGCHWVHDAASWDLRAAPEHSGLWGEVAASLPRWALWVGFGEEGFRQAYQTLRLLRAEPTPRQLLVVHPPVASRRGLLNNIQEVAARYLDIELLILAR